MATMRLVSYDRGTDTPRAGIMTDHGIIDIHEGLALVNDERPPLPIALSDIVAGRHEIAHLGTVAVIEEVIDQLQEGGEIAYWFGGVEMLLRRNDVALLPPFPDVTAWWRCALMVDTYADMLKTRGEHLPMYWYERPQLWAAYAPQRWGDRALVPFPDTTHCDVECEIGWVTQRAIRDADASDAADAVLGLFLIATVVDATRAAEDVVHGQWSRPVGVVLGPMVTCMDELTEFVLPDGHLRLDVRLLVNDEPVAMTHIRDAHWRMGDVLAHASDGQTVAAGTLFSSGVVCRLGGSGAPWLVPGDAVAVDAGPLGTLRWTMEG